MTLYILRRLDQRIGAQHCVLFSFSDTLILAIKYLVQID